MRDPDDYLDEYYEYYNQRDPDPKQISAEEELEQFFAENKDKVFYSRQIEIRYEGKYFHWITNRALRELVASGKVNVEERKLEVGGRGNKIKIYFHPSNRYYKRAANKLVELVELYSSPSVAREVGRNGEMLTLEAFARSQFVQFGRECNVYNGKEWKKSDHDIDFIFKRENVDYGIEVKNMLGYMEHDELKIKTELCRHLGIRPVFVVRMAPQHWFQDVTRYGGFILILKYQLYPTAFKDLAARIKNELALPVDTPNVIADYTMKRFLDWHTKNT